MKTKIHVQGRPAIEVDQPGTVTVEVELDDGRTVQLSVDETGVILLRSWTNIPEETQPDEWGDFPGEKE